MYRINNPEKNIHGQENAKLAQTLGMLGINSGNATKISAELAEKLGINVELLHSIATKKTKVMAPIPPHKSERKRRRRDPGSELEEILLGIEISRVASMPPTTKQEDHWKLLQNVTELSSTQGEIHEPCHTNPYDLVIQTAALIRANSRS